MAGTIQLRRSTRPGKGKGGVVTRLTDLLELIERKPKEAKARVQDIPNSEVVNPMVPKVKKRRPRKAKAVDMPEATREVTPPYLVPPGTEPQLPAHQITSHGHAFRFQLPGALQGQATGVKAPSKVAISNIDPVLTALDEHSEASDKDGNDQESEEDETSDTESDENVECRGSDIANEEPAGEGADVVNDNGEDVYEGTVMLCLLRLLNQLTSV